MKTRTGLLALSALLPLLGLGAFPAAAVPGSFVAIVQIAGSLPNAIGVTNAGDGSGRLFVVQQTGQIRIWNGSQILSAPFLDVSALSSSCSGGCGERGLLGLAFHPSFETNGLFYVYYTRQSDGAIQVARYHATPGSNLADTSGTVLLTIPHPNNANHNGGHLAFGPDGYLYIGTGDGGGGGDPDENGQNINALLGKILRIDVNGDDFPGDTSRNYAIPPTNPFAGATPGADEVWAYGLRNPWHFSFDRATGDLYIGDVGQNLWEEIDYQAAGAAGGRNYGWDCREGAHDYSDPNGDMNVNCPVPSTDPVLEYDHAGGRCSVTGGFVFHDLPAHTATGNYFYGDYCSGQIWLGSRSTGTWMSSQVVDTAFNITSFGESEKGRIYFTTGQALQWLAPYTFADVTPAYFAWPFVESIYGNGITSGCGGDNYCPETSITRAEMSVFLLKAEHGAAYTPPACTTPMFSDVPCSSQYAAWINQLAREGVTSGCGGGNYCPGSAVTRDQMAVFLLATREGTGYTPPACGTPSFADVPCSSSFAPWVDELARRGVTGGCGGGNYCPANPVTRGQIAVFLATTFGLATP
jgi:glucose/arabinose dehydrogenase